MKGAIAVLLWLPLLAAAELAPVLAPLAATHKEELAKLDEERETEAQGPRASYLAALRHAEETATAAGETELVGVLGKEIRLVENGGVTPLPPPGFSRKLQSTHKTFARAMERINEGVDRKRKELNSRYLMALAKIQPKPGEDPALEEQIQAEKERVLSGISGPITDLRTQLKGTRWQDVGNPNVIHHFREDGRFSHWRFTTPERDVAVIHWNASRSKHLKLAKDGKTLLHGGAPNMVLVRDAAD